MNSRKIWILAFNICFIIGMGIFDLQAQCLASIVDGNGSFNDNQIGWSSPSLNAAVQASPAPEGASSDGGAYLRMASTGSNEEVNITMNSLTNGGMYLVDWEVIHGLASTAPSYPNGVTYTVNILDGPTVIASQDFSIDDPSNWVPQTFSFTSSATDLIFQISLAGSDFTSGTYKMGIDGMTITCNGTTRPCDLVAPTYKKQ